MLGHKKIDIICCVVVVAALLITALFINAEALGIQAADTVMGYEERLFDAGKVHTVDIVIDDWDSFLTTCQSEEYSVCSVLIDGEAFGNVGIRGKGNTSLSTVSSMDSNRYSFKIEFDQYDSTKSYYGLDKLCLNNIIQDNTYMKDFLVYQMMAEFGVDAPLCSYVYITVNGEDWGLYLAVEGVEESFLQRNYGSNYGELYKPDSMSFGGGRGNGKEFNMEELDFGQQWKPGETENAERPEGAAADRKRPGADTDDSAGGRESFGGFGMGSSDVKLQYIDDEASSYSNIFNNAKTNVTEADQERLIASLKALSEGEALEEIVDMDEVIRYFVVHNFVVNGDSYTGSMIHNYYLYEEDGQLSMIPWDYNLAFGTFQGNSAESAVNDPIDSPVSGGTSDRPMIDWIFADEKYTELYHEYFADFMETMFESGRFIELVDSAIELISPYVEKDPTSFCTYEEFLQGAETIRQFCLLRAESVSGQLAGTIPSTSEGQSADSSALIDASFITISDMGTMGMGGRGGFGGGGMPQMPEGMEFPGGGDMKEMPEMPGGIERPDGMEFPGSFGAAGNTEGASTQLVLLIASGICLLAGLLAAFKYKR